jgi:hypothetical protein
MGLWSRVPSAKAVAEAIRHQVQVQEVQVQVQQPREPGAGAQSPPPGARAALAAALLLLLARFFLLFGLAVPGLLLISSLGDHWVCWYPLVCQ